MGRVLRIFWKIIYKLDNIIDPKTKSTMIEIANLKVLLQCQKNSKDKIQSEDIKIDRSWISNFASHTKINNKNVIKIDENEKITIKPQLLISMSARSK